MGIACCNYCRQIHSIEESDSTLPRLFCSKDCEDWYMKYDKNLERVKELVND
jgi:hypothetical protein